MRVNPKKAVLTIPAALVRQFPHIFEESLYGYYSRRQRRIFILSQPQEEAMTSRLPERSRITRITSCIEELGIKRDGYSTMLTMPARLARKAGFETGDQTRFIIKQERCSIVNESKERTSSPVGIEGKRKVALKVSIAGFAAAVPLLFARLYPDLVCSSLPVGFAKALCYWVNDIGASHIALFAGLSGSLLYFSYLNSHRRPQWPTYFATMIGCSVLTELLQPYLRAEWIFFLFHRHRTFFFEWADVIMNLIGAILAAAIVEKDQIQSVFHKHRHLTAAPTGRESSSSPIEKDRILPATDGSFIEKLYDVRQCLEKEDGPRNGLRNLRLSVLLQRFIAGLSPHERQVLCFGISMEYFWYNDVIQRINNFLRMVKAGYPIPQIMRGNEVILNDEKVCIGICAGLSEDLLSLLTAAERFRRDAQFILVLNPQNLSVDYAAINPLLSIRRGLVYRDGVFFFVHWNDPVVIDGVGIFEPYAPWDVEKKLQATGVAQIGSEPIQNIANDKELSYAALSRDTQISLPHEISFRELPCPEASLPMDLADSLIAKMRQAGIQEIVCKPACGVQGRDVIFARGDNGVHAQMDEIYRLHQQEKMIIQERVFPPDLIVNGVMYDFNLRAFGCRTISGDFVVSDILVRYGTGAVNLSRGAQPMEVETVLDMLNILEPSRRGALVEDWERVVQRIALAVEYAARVKNKLLRKAVPDDSQQLLPDFLEVDIIPEISRDRHVPWVIEINGHNSAGMWDIDQLRPLAQRGRAYRPLIELIIHRAREYRQQRPVLPLAQASSSLKDTAKVSLKEKTEPRVFKGEFAQYTHMTEDRFLEMFLLPRFTGEEWSLRAKTFACFCLPHIVTAAKKDIFSCGTLANDAVGFITPYGFNVEILEISLPRPLAAQLYRKISSHVVVIAQIGGQFFLIDPAARQFEIVNLAEFIAIEEARIHATRKHNAAANDRALLETLQSPDIGLVVIPLDVVERNPAGLWPYHSSVEKLYPFAWKCPVRSSSSPVKMLQANAEYRQYTCPSDTTKLASIEEKMEITKLPAGLIVSEKLVLRTIQDAVKQARGRVKKIPSDQWLGVFLPAPLVRLTRGLKYIGIAPHEKFLDLGSGNGIVVLSVAYVCKAESVGIEGIGTLFKRSCVTSEILKERLPGEPNRAHFLQGNYFEEDWTRFDLIYYYSFGSSQAKLIAWKVYQELKPGGRFVVLGDRVRSSHYWISHFQDFRGFFAKKGGFSFQAFPGFSLWVFTRDSTKRIVSSPVQVRRQIAGALRGLVDANDPEIPTIAEFFSALDGTGRRTMLEVGVGHDYRWTIAALRVGFRVTTVQPRFYRGRDQEDLYLRYIEGNKVEHARHRVPLQNLTCRWARVQDVDFGRRRFSLVVLKYVFDSPDMKIEDREKIVQKVVDVLGNGGVVVFRVVNRSGFEWFEFAEGLVDEILAMMRTYAHVQGREASIEPNLQRIFSKMNEGSGIRCVKIMPRRKILPPQSASSALEKEIPALLKDVRRCIARGGCQSNYLLRRIRHAIAMNQASSEDFAARFIEMARQAYRTKETITLKQRIGNYRRGETIPVIEVYAAFAYALTHIKVRDVSLWEEFCTTLALYGINMRLVFKYKEMFFKAVPSSSYAFSKSGFNKLSGKFRIKNPNGIHVRPSQTIEGIVSQIETYGVLVYLYSPHAQEGTVADKGANILTLALKYNRAATLTVAGACSRRILHDYFELAMRLFRDYTGLLQVLSEEEWNEYYERRYLRRIRELGKMKEEEGGGHGRT
ncbi:MAG: class I SAM-dependent methyltransferase [Candidatus Omnitrophica bacterium]|nr:class I SAM-dependent methyltransferase [Candidatus Omnitrophota bacterium]